MTDDIDALREQLRANLARHQRMAIDPSGHRHAAVAVVVVHRSEADEVRATRRTPGILLTKRTPTLRSHGGQWALPGGRLDDGETPELAAQRELREELGLDLHAGQMLGVLDDYATRSGYVITPVVFWGGVDPPLEPNPDEVRSVHHVSFAELQRPDSPRFVSIPESERPVVQIFFNESTIHAPTAAIVLQFRRVVIEGTCERVAEYEQPVFAWR